jgi:fluoroquinolone transport system permease protein
MKRIVRLWSVDLRLSWRDPITSYPLVIPIFFALLLRWLLPGLMDRLSPRIDLAPYIPVVAAMLAIFPPALYGMVAGFLMLDERDDRTLLALQVTPLSRGSYAWYRLLSPILPSLVLILIVLPLSGTVQVSPLTLLVGTLLASLGAPLMAFLLSGFAGNKIEGLALMKVFSLVLVIPIASLVVPDAWQIALWPIPSYWPFRFLTRATDGAPLMELAGLWLGGVAVHSLHLAALFRRLSGRSYAS